MPLTLPNLYCSPADVVDYLSSEGVELRLDDHNQATGQQIEITQAQSQGATSLLVTALEAALPNGCVLNFDGAGLSAVLQVILTANTGAGAVTLPVMPLLGPLSVGAFAFDNGVNVATWARVVKGISYATAQIKRYCCNRYNDSALVNAWSVNNWATVISARWISKRRGQGCPAGIEDDYRELKEELQQVKGGQLNIEDIATRTSGWPSWSNMSEDLTYDGHIIRVEQSTSEPTPTQYQQYVDWYDQFSFDF